MNFKRKPWKGTEKRNEHLEIKFYDGNQVDDKIA